jgi:hypothetical protein
MFVHPSNHYLVLELFKIKEREAIQQANLARLMTEKKSDRPNPHHRSLPWAGEMLIYLGMLLKRSVPTRYSPPVPDPAALYQTSPAG